MSILNEIHDLVERVKELEEDNKRLLNKVILFEGVDDIQAAHSELVEKYFIAIKALEEIRDYDAWMAWLSIRTMKILAKNAIKQSKEYKR